MDVLRGPAGQRYDRQSAPIDGSAPVFDQMNAGAVVARVFIAVHRHTLDLRAEALVEHQPGNLIPGRIIPARSS